MKAFIVLLTVAAASAQWWPTAYTGWNGAAVLPYANTWGWNLKPEEYHKTPEYKTGMPMGWLGSWATMPKLETKYANFGEYKAEAAGGVVHKAKRDADADPWMIYNNWAGAMPYAWNNLAYTSVAAPYAWTGMPYAWPLMPKMVKNDRVMETGDYANKNEYVADNGAVVHLAKRDADADPWMIYNNWAGAMPYAWNNMAYTTAARVAAPYAWTGMPYAWPLIPKTKLVADDTLKANTPDYANKNEYVADNGAVVHKAKRDADAQWLVGANTIIPTAARTIVPAARTIVPAARTIVPAARTIVPAARTIVPAARTIVSPYHNTWGAVRTLNNGWWY